MWAFSFSSPSQKPPSFSWASWCNLRTSELPRLPDSDAEKDGFYDHSIWEKEEVNLTEVAIFLDRTVKPMLDPAEVEPSFD